MEICDSACALWIYLPGGIELQTADIWELVFLYSSTPVAKSVLYSHCSFPYFASHPMSVLSQRCSGGISRILCRTMNMFWEPKISELPGTIVDFCWCYLLSSCGVMLAFSLCSKPNLFGSKYTAVGTTQIFINSPIHSCWASRIKSLWIREWNYGIVSVVRFEMPKMMDRLMSGSGMSLSVIWPRMMTSCL